MTFLNEFAFSPTTVFIFSSQNNTRSTYLHNISDIPRNSQYVFLTLCSDMTPMCAYGNSAGN